MLLQGCLRLFPALMLELPEALVAEAVVAQRRQSAHLAYTGTDLRGILRRDGKDSKDSASEFETYG
jgi:hypothetical protein